MSLTYSKWLDFIAGSREVYLVKVWCGVVLRGASPTFETRVANGWGQVFFNGFRLATNNSDEFVPGPSASEIGAKAGFCFSTNEQFFYRIDRNLNLANTTGMIMGLDFLEHDLPGGFTARGSFALDFEFF